MRFARVRNHFSQDMYHLIRVSGIQLRRQFPFRFAGQASQSSWGRLSPGCAPTLKRPARQAARAGLVSRRFEKLGHSCSASSRPQWKWENSRNFWSTVGSISLKSPETISLQLLCLCQSVNGILSFQSGSYSNRPVDGAQPVDNGG